MKWFKHFTDSHTNLKLREILFDFGIEGYALFWLCLELVGQQGSNYRLNGTKSWKKVLKDVSKLPDEKMDTILKNFGRLNLICSKSLLKGDLYIPKMKERADEYSVRKSGQYRENIVLEQNRIDKNRIDIVIQAFISKKNLQEQVSNNKEFLSYLYQRHGRTIKQLLILAKGDDKKVIDSMNWFGDICDKKGLSWTLETILKWYPEYISKGKVDIIPEEIQKALKEVRYGTTAGKSI